MERNTHYVTLVIRLTDVTDIFRHRWRHSSRAAEYCNAFPQMIHLHKQTTNLLTYDVTTLQLRHSIIVAKMIRYRKSETTKSGDNGDEVW